MPQTYEATDPKTGKKWTWDGKKWNEDKASSKLTEGLKTYGREQYLGAMENLGLEESAHPIKGALESAGKSAATPSANWADPTAGAATGVYGSLKNFFGSGKEMMQGAGMNPATFYSGGVLPSFKQGPTDVAKLGHGQGGVEMSILQAFLGKETAEKPTKSTVIKPVLRDLLGAGKMDVVGEIARDASKEAVEHAKAVKKVEATKERYGEALQAAVKKRIEASAKETAAKTKQEALSTKHGPVYKRMNEMADTAREHVTQMEEKVNTAESAKWDKFSENMDNAPVKTEKVADLISYAEEKILTGESLPIFKQIMIEITADDPLAEASVFKGKDKGGPKGTNIKDFMDKMEPAKRERMLREMKAMGMDAGNEFTPQTTDVPLDLARRLYTKISRKLNASELPRDVARAMTTVAEGLDDGIAQAVTKKGGAEGLRDYRQLQADWRKYRETFSDRGSPLRRIMEAKDPNTKLNPITSETGARAVEYLGRYKDMGAQPEQLGKIRALHKALKELPTSGGKAPEVPKRPELPNVPAEGKTSVEQARLQLLEGKEKFYSRPPSRWELMFPPLLGYKMTLKHLMQNPKFRKWLASDEKAPTTAVPGGESPGRGL